MNTITIKGARQHNLKNVDLTIPKNSLVVFSGLSGSGKSSLAFDTIYAEGQRRYVESLSSYARQFLGVMDKPDVDLIEGLSPAISIDQKSTSHNPRSTVGTVTEIYDYLRLLYAKVGHPHCPSCGREISRQSADQIVRTIIRYAQTAIDTGDKQYRVVVLSPIIRDHKGEFTALFNNIRSKGYKMVRIDGKYIDLDTDITLLKTNKHTVEVVIDKLSIDRAGLKEGFVRELRGRIADAVEQSLRLSDGLVVLSHIEDLGFVMPEKPVKGKDYLFSEKLSCPSCNISLHEIEPRSFSFNSPHGACVSCTGIGKILMVDPVLIISEDLSLSEGGILPFANLFSHDTWYARVVSTVCKTHEINERVSLKSLSQKQRDILLMGTGNQVYRVTGKNRFGEKTAISEVFTGFIHELKRRHKESESDFMKNEIGKFMREKVCESCHGRRLKPESLTVTIADKSIADVTDLPIQEAHAWINDLQSNTQKELTQSEQTIATPIIKEVENRLGFLVSVGLSYLTLGRGASTLAGGEAQRIRLASQIGSGLTGVLYVLDEPSIGLHPRDNDRLIKTLEKLRDLENTVLVVEHDREMIEAADWVVDFGPGAGKHGGMVTAQGTVSDIIKNPKSLTGLYLSGKRSIKIPLVRPAVSIKALPSIALSGITHNNLSNLTVQFPIGVFTCVTGVSGSGKSSLIVETLYPALMRALNTQSKETPGLYKTLTGIHDIEKVILIDQSPIGRTPRSNPATYTGLFTIIREIFAETSEARLRGYKAGRFSFNVKGGRCEACEGEGQRKIEMQFLADVYVSCEVCHGNRYSAETLEVTYRGKSIAEVLSLTIEESIEFFHAHPLVTSKLQTLKEVGLSYIQLGQIAPTLSGGEAQRVKLASELAKKSTGKTVYILDEPTTGLHFADLEKLLLVLHKLSSVGNTVIVIEHNLDVIKTADWVIDLGPEGGNAGGNVVAVGTPADIAKTSQSYTGKYLKSVLE